MAYNFTFDLSKLSQTLFREIAEFSEKGKITERIGDMAINLVKKFNIDKITGLPVCDSITVIEDLVNANIKNSIHKESFVKTNKRVLFLPHCCRKYMDSRCKADFDPESASYLCRHCSDDCQVHKATKLAKKENYDVYVLPGSSCVKKIFQKNSYDGVIGVACTEEIGLATKILEQFNIAVQNIPLIKNGCSGTQFNFETLQRIMDEKTTMSQNPIRKMSNKIASQIHTVVMHGCVPEAVGIAKDLGLPPPIPLPQVRLDAKSKKAEFGPEVA